MRKALSDLKGSVCRVKFLSKEMDGLTRDDDINKRVSVVSMLAKEQRHMVSLTNRVKEKSNGIRTGSTAR